MLFDKVSQNTFFKKIYQKSFKIPFIMMNKTLDKLAKSHKLSSPLLKQPKSLSDFLPYEDFLDYEGKTYVILQDGVGLIWKLSPIAHEVMSLTDLSDSILRMTSAIEKVRDKDVILQFILDSEPSSDFQVPDYFLHPKTAAQQMMHERIKSFVDLNSSFSSEDNNQNSSDHFPLIKRSYYLCIKIPTTEHIGIEVEYIHSSEHSVKKIEDLFLEKAEKIEKDIIKLKNIVENFESSLFCIQKGFSDLKNLSRTEYMSFLRNVFHSNAFKSKQNNKYNLPYQEEYSISKQLLLEDVACSPSALEVGEKDTWEFLSWRMQPYQTFLGKMTGLLRIKTPFRFVLNIRCNITEYAKEDLKTKESRLKHAMTEEDKIQKEEVQDSLRRLEINEQMVGVSMHFFHKNIDKNIHQLQKESPLSSVMNTLERELDIPFYHEKWAGLSIFENALPLAYHPRSASFTGREEMILSRDLSCYLPILGGFQGHPGQVMLMQERSGSACWISPRSSPTSPHVAVLGSSGSGKSFLSAHFLLSVLAEDPLTNIYILDVKTSYLMIAKALSHNENHYSVINPPQKFPNIFLGDITDPERISLIISILKTAMTLCDPSVHLTLEHQSIIEYAIKMSYEHKKKLGYEHWKINQKENKEDEIKKENYYFQVPKMDDIVSCLSESCTLLDFDQEYAKYIMNKLKAFCSGGIYGTVFNNEEYSDSEEESLKQINLYDLEGVLENKIIRTLAAQVCISDIVRMIKHDKNKGKKSVFLIDEAGVLLESKEENKELVDFVISAWKTFRKMNTICYGITNSVLDYKYISGCRSIWNVSPHKIILKMTTADIQEASQKSEGENQAFFFENDSSIVKSLHKRDGKYSEIYFKSDSLKSGTFIYKPTGYDYWLSVSRKEEIQTVEDVKEKIGSYAKSIQILAHYYPFGVFEIKNGQKNYLILKKEEIQKLCLLYEKDFSS